MSLCKAKVLLTRVASNLILAKVFDPFCHCTFWAYAHKGAGAKLLWEAEHPHLHCMMKGYMVHDATDPDPEVRDDLYIDFALAPGACASDYTQYFRIRVSFTANYISGQPGETIAYELWASGTVHADPVSPFISIAGLTAGTAGFGGISGTAGWLADRNRFDSYRRGSHRQRPLRLPLQA